MPRPNTALSESSLEYMNINGLPCTRERFYPSFYVMVCCVYIRNKAPNVEMGRKYSYTTRNNALEWYSQRSSISTTWLLCFLARSTLKLIRDKISNSHSNRHMHVRMYMHIYFFHFLVKIIQIHFVHLIKLISIYAVKYLTFLTFLMI